MVQLRLGAPALTVTMLPDWVSPYGNGTRRRGGREKLQITSGPVLRGFYTGWGGTRSVTEKSIDSCGRKKKEKNFTGQNVEPERPESCRSSSTSQIVWCLFLPTSTLPCLLRLGIIFGTMHHPALTAEDPRILSRWGFSVRSVEPSLDGLVRLRPEPVQSMRGPYLD